MGRSKANNHKIIKEVLSQYEQMVNRELEATLIFQDWEPSNSVETSSLTIDVLEKWHRTAREKLKQERKFYVNKLLALHEVTFVLTDEKFVLADNIRNECLEYLLRELDEIVMDLVEFVQMQE